jgi:hypothetical protein
LRPNAHHNLSSVAILVWEEGRLITLTLDLQEGFEGDQVVLAIDGRELYRKNGIRTRLQIGLAERVQLSVEPGQHILKVSLPGRSMQGERHFNAESEPVLAVSLIDGRIDIGPPRAPGYL